VKKRQIVPPSNRKEKHDYPTGKIKTLLYKLKRGATKQGLQVEQSKLSLNQNGSCRFLYPPFSSTERGGAAVVITARSAESLDRPPCFYPITYNLVDRVKPGKNKYVSLHYSLYVFIFLMLAYIFIQIIFTPTYPFPPPPPKKRKKKKTIYLTYKKFI